ncbi:uncharacterized protein LOC144094479 [Amblyomma americanum]
MPTSSAVSYPGTSCAGTLLVKISLWFLVRTVCATSDAPILRIDSGFVTGQRIQVGGKELYAYLGIPYAQPPIGDLRFQKPLPVSPWEGVYNASSKPKPCRQLSMPLVGSLSLNYSGSSEDCLQVNVWLPNSACPEIGKCGGKLPVIVFIHGGTFQWGDSALFLHDPANFVALSEVVFVTFNYRVGLHGFLSLEVPELPGNFGLWDQNLALKWVCKNVAAFGGDPDDVTVFGQSAGAISVAIHAVSPHSKGLFKRAIMQSGAPLTLTPMDYLKGKAKFISVAATLGCYDPKKTLDEQLKEAIRCLQKQEPAEMIQKLEKLDFVQHAFAPIDKDEFVPFSLASPDTWSRINVKEVILGNTENEAGIFFHYAAISFPEVVEILLTEYRTAATLVITQAFSAPMFQARRIVSAYFGDAGDDIRYELLRDTVAEMIGDALFYCPTLLFADSVSESGVKTYKYEFAYKPSHSFYPKWMGVAHGEDVMYTLGSLPFIKDKSRYTEPLGRMGKKFLATQDYTDEEEHFMKELVSAFHSFARTGKPVIPHPHVEWPEYTKESRRVLVLKPNNYTIVRDTKRERCELWKPLLYKSGLSKGKRATTTAKPAKPGSSVTTKKKLPHLGRGHSASSSPTSIRLPGMLGLAACAVACLNARLFSTCFLIQLERNAHLASSSYSNSVLHARTEIYAGGTERHADLLHNMPKSSGISSSNNCCVSVLLVKLSLWGLLATGATTSNAPVVRIDSGLLTGQRIQVGGKELYAYLGIPYAQPPIGDLRFRKPLPVSPWEGVYNASSKPRPCRQLPVPLVADLTLNYSGSSEDCLQINVWLPSSACPETGSCGGKLPVIVFIHGGGFQWGDSALFLHDPANFVALSDVVFVTFNYRVGLHGFLSLEVPELPGNVGLWDQNLALKWVRKNIAAFGGDPEDVTIDGQSAGAISVALHTVSPHSKGLFKRAIMQSGAPLSLATSDFFYGKGKFINVAATLGCYDPKKTHDEQLTEALRCLRKLEPGEMIQKLEKLDFVQHAFAPIDNDEFLPFSVSSHEPWSKLNVKEVMLGTTENEAAIFFYFATTLYPEVVEALVPQYRTAATVVITLAFGAPMFQARRIVSSYFGDGDEDLTYEQLRHIAEDMISDAVFFCPALLFADSVSESGIKTYKYEFAYKPSHSFYPNSMGVAHGEDIMYTLGSLPFIKDKSRYTEPLGKFGKKFLATQDYTDEEEQFMKELVGAFNSFARTGKPVIPHSHVEWPEYTTQTRRMLVLKPNNYTIVRDTKRERCELWKPLLYKSDFSKGTRTTTTAKPTKPGSGFTDKKKAMHPGKGHSAGSSLEGVRLCGILVLAAGAVTCLNARMFCT